jgi:hypothetical protein
MTVAQRKWTCNGCGYTDSQIGSYYKMKKSWDTIHTLEFCKGRKNEMFAGTLDALAKLTIVK